MLGSLKFVFSKIIAFFPNFQSFTQKYNHKTKKESHNKPEMHNEHQKQKRSDLTIHGLGHKNLHIFYLLANPLIHYFSFPGIPSEWMDKYFARNLPFWKFFRFFFLYKNREKDKCLVRSTFSQ